MASRVVEVLYRLKDLFTPEAKKVDKAYDDLAEGAEEAAESIEETNRKIAGSLGDLNEKISAFEQFSRAQAIGRSVVEFGKILIDINDEILNVARSANKLGISAQQFLDLEDVARSTNIAFGDLEGGIDNLNRTIQLAEAGSKSAREAFEAINLTAEDLNRLDPAGQIERLAVAFEDLGGNEQALNQIAQFLGRDVNDGLLQLIREGPAAFQKIAQNAENAGRVIDEDLVKAAENFARITQTVQEGWERIAGNLAGIAIQGIDTLLGTIDLKPLTELQKLEEERADLAERFLDIQEKIRNDNSRSNAAISKYKKELEGVNEALDDNLRKLSSLRIFEGLRRTQLAENAEASREAAQADAAYAEQIARLEQAYKDQSKALKATLAEETRDLKAARREQVRVEEEFADLIEGVTTRQLTPEDVNLGSVFGQINLARAEAERGEFEKAVETARRGGEFLELLQEKGTETQGTLNFLAKQLREVAVESAKARTAEEQTDQTAAQEALNTFTQQLEVLKTTAPAAGAQYAQDFIKGWEEVFARTPLPSPTVASPEGQGAASAQTARSARPIRREGNSFYTEQLISERERRAGK